MIHHSLRKQIKQVRFTAGNIAFIGSLSLFLLFYDPNASIFSIRSSLFFSCLLCIISGVFSYFMVFLYLLKKAVSPRHYRKVVTFIFHFSNKQLKNIPFHSSVIHTPSHRNDDWYNNPGNPASPSYFGHFQHRFRDRN